MSTALVMMGAFGAVAFLLFSARQAPTLAAPGDGNAVAARMALDPAAPPGAAQAAVQGNAPVGLGRPPPGSGPRSRSDGFDPLAYDTTPLYVAGRQPLAFDDVYPDGMTREAPAMDAREARTVPRSIVRPIDESFSPVARVVDPTVAAVTRSGANAGVTAATGVPALGAAASVLAGVALDIFGGGQSSGWVGDGSKSIYRAPANTDAAAAEMLSMLPLAEQRLIQGDPNNYVRAGGNKGRLGLLGDDA